MRGLARAEQRLIGTATTDPAFGLPAAWIEEAQTEAAQMAGYTVVDCSNVVATHLSHLMQLHAAKLLGRVKTRQLVQHAIKLAPSSIKVKRPVSQPERNPRRRFRRKTGVTSATGTGT
jgi:flagellar biosynthesis protein FlhA